MSTRLHVCVVFLVLGLSSLLSACQGQAGQTSSTSAGEPSPSQAAGLAAPGVSPVDLPDQRLDRAGDVDSVKYANKRAAPGGDVFVEGLYERPFNANIMDTYFPYLDIVDLQGFKDETWGYASITLSNTDADGKLPGQYAVEMDLDRDGRGDWLVKAAGVSSTDWSRQGVQALTSSNRDIGGDAAMIADKRPGGGDGYEKLVFDQGQGSLTDGAFARIRPSDPKTVEIAFKLSMLGSPASYAMGAWAGTDLDAGLFDYNDHMTHIQAGSPNPGYEVYPLKDLAEIDNTCRLAIGFDASASVPGLCSFQQRQAEKEGCDSAVTGIPCAPPP